MWFRGKQSFNSSNSAAQSDLQITLQELGLHVKLDTPPYSGLMFDKEVDGVEGSMPDFRWSDPYRYAVFLDGRKIHLRRVSLYRDLLIDRALRKREYSVNRFIYDPPLSKRLRLQIAKSIREVLLAKGYTPFRG